jgi:hypothetical protein
MKGQKMTNSKLETTTTTTGTKQSSGVGQQKCLLERNNLQNRTICKHNETLVTETKQVQQRGQSRRLRGAVRFVELYANTFFKGTHHCDTQFTQGTAEQSSGVGQLK